jgi:hypothetical protein
LAWPGYRFAGYIRVVEMKVMTCVGVSVGKVMPNRDVASCRSTIARFIALGFDDGPWTSCVDKGCLGHPPVITGVTIIPDPRVLTCVAVVSQYVSIPIVWLKSVFTLVNARKLERRSDCDIITQSGEAEFGRNALTLLRSPRFGVFTAIRWKVMVEVGRWITPASIERQI